MVLALSENDSSILQYGIIQLNPKISYFDRIVCLEPALDNLVQKYSIDAIQAEDIQMQRDVTTYKKLAALLFFLQMYAHNKKIDFFTPVHVNTWRLKTVRSLFELPKGDKTTWYNYVFSQVVQESLTTDHSDAIGIAIHLAVMLGRSIPSLNGLIQKDDICI